jgi:hypothetical protein
MAHATRQTVEAGGLMSYGTDNEDMFHQVGVYTSGRACVWFRKRHPSCLFDHLVGERDQEGRNFAGTPNNERRERHRRHQPPLRLGRTALWES